MAVAGGAQVAAGGSREEGGEVHGDTRTNLKVVEVAGWRRSSGREGARCRCWCCRCSWVAACQESCYCGCCRAMSDMLPGGGSAARRPAMKQLLNN